MHFELKDLELFLAVVDAGSIAKAAARCYTSASAISKRLSDLEKHLGTPLLLRSSQGISLTPAGHTLQLRARSLLDQVWQMQGELRDFQLGLRGQVRLAANISSIVEFLPHALAVFMQRYPEIQIHLQQQVSHAVAQAVADNVADLGLISAPVPHAGLTIIPFRQDRLTLIAPADHSLAAHVSVRFSDILDYNFVGLPPGSALHQCLLRAAAEFGRNLQMRIQVNSFDAVGAMVAAGLGIGIVPHAAAQAYVQPLGLTMIELLDDWALRQFYLCLRSPASLSVASKLLFDHLLDGDGQPSPTTMPASSNSDTSLRENWVML